MNLTSSVTPATSFLSARERRRAAAPFLPRGALSARTAVWSALLGVGLITPLAVGVGLLHLPEGPNSFAVAQQRWLGYLAQPGTLFLRAVILYPLLEEVFYRGLMLQLLRRYCPAWLALGISAALFGATHIAQGGAGVLNAVLLGGVFAWLVMRTRSLAASVLCHAAVNFSWLFLITPGFGVAERMVTHDAASPGTFPGPLALFPAWWLVTSLALAIAAVVMLRPAASRPTTR